GPDRVRARSRHPDSARAGRHATQSNARVGPHSPRPPQTRHPAFVPVLPSPHHHRHLHHHLLRPALPHPIRVHGVHPPRRRLPPRRQAVRLAQLRRLSRP